jgi:hypothetical protein
MHKVQGSIPGAGRLEGASVRNFFFSYYNENVFLKDRKKQKFIFLLLSTLHVFANWS